MKAILTLLILILTSSCGHKTTCKVEPEISINKAPTNLEELDPNELKDHVQGGGSLNCSF